VRAARRRAARGAARPRRAAPRRPRPGVWRAGRRRPARLPDGGPAARPPPRLAVSGEAIVLVAAGPRTPWSVLRVSPGGAVETIRQPAVDAPDPGYLPDARPVQLSAGQNGPVVHALVYPPANPEVAGPAGELPPFIVHVHGGPTANSVPVLSLEKAF